MILPFLNRRPQYSRTFPQRRRIEVKLHQSVPNGTLRVVRASIDGQEINEQLVLRPQASHARFVGWLQDGTGAKRIRFTFPTGAQNDSVVTVGVFSATETEAGSKETRVPLPPPSATGESFSGPQVGSARYAHGEVVAFGSAQLRVER